MALYQGILVLFAMCMLFGQVSFAQTIEDVFDAQLNNNIEKLIDYSKLNGEVAQTAQKALLTTISYDEIKDYLTAKRYYHKAKSNPLIEPVFKVYVEMYKQEELTKMSRMNIGELNLYMSKADEYKQLADSMFHNTILLHTDALTLDNLNYLCKELPYYTAKFNEERKTRSKEVQQTLRVNVNKYTVKESSYLRNFNYIIERSAYDYLYDSYKYIAEAYSKVSKVPDKESDIEKQFNMIVSTVFSSKKYQSYLQTEIDKFCKSVNQSRKLYAKTAGVKKYTKLSLMIPKISFNNYVADNKGIKKIIQEIEDNSTYNNIADAVSFVGNFIPGWGWVAKGGAFLAKAYLSNELVENVTAARKEYMGDVLLALEKNILVETQRIENILYKQMIENESKYISDVKN